MFRTAVRARRAALTTAASLVLVVGLSACSGDGSDSDDGDGPPGADAPPPGIRTTATIGKVTGKLARGQRAPLRKKVTATFDSWVDAAYLSGGGGDAFAGFVKDAAKLAKKDGAQMSNGALRDRVDSVTATTRKLSIEVLADKGRPAAVTGRFVLVLDLDGQTTRTDRIAGRLFLRRGHDGWKIFGYEVKRGTVA
jgi:hypothetical protein